MISLAVPRHVTVFAEKTPNAIAPGHHWLITGFYPHGEVAFADHVIAVQPSEASTPTEAIDAALCKMRERGW
ncbi:hypothetical protein [Frankia sp. AgW1.1]|uniref:hypothetical protein n=1 Tax=Frankia sp. AgW1.1 TaxID=1836971 RepID=UPI0019347966|nr:hypothetical protein [Frankia sp. AgW1.1]MBL7487149.1 hypothetical protein [Frankia sp. AgW1.1]